MDHSQMNLRQLPLGMLRNCQEKGSDVKAASLLSRRKEFPYSCVQSLGIHSQVAFILMKILIQIEKRRR